MKTIIFFCFVILNMQAYAQLNDYRPIAINSDNWVYEPGTVEFLEYKSQMSMHLLTSTGISVLRDVSFGSGTIEFDIELLDPQFNSFYFRWKDARENECFYFRTGRAGNPEAVDAVQYAPTIAGVSLWDLLPDLQSNASFHRDEWNRVKLVIAGSQMKAYVNNLEHPTLTVPTLGSNSLSGTLAFSGQSIISNLRIRPGGVVDSSSHTGVDLTDNDPRYLHRWQVSEPIMTEQNIDFSYEYIPGPKTKWREITAEHRGLVNLTRAFGSSRGRRIVWLKTSIYSDKTQIKTLRLGFSDEVWVLVNEEPLYVDKNLYNTPMAKQPDGRCSIENSTISIPLKEGDNELMVGVTNFFYGWGIVARLDDLNEISLVRER